MSKPERKMNLNLWICINFRTGLTAATEPIMQFFEKDIDITNELNIPNGLPGIVEAALGLMNTHCTAKWV